MYHKGVSLREVDRASTLSLPNISMGVPEIQVSSEETASSARYSTESKAFWDETTELLQELSILREDVADILCPCRKPSCPFKHEKHTKKAPLRTGRRVSLQEQVPLRNKLLTSRGNGYLSSSACRNVATYLASMHPTQNPSAVMSSLFHRQDCQVTEEPLASHEEDYFVRSSPFRRAQRRHSTTMRVSTSYPITMNSLTVPSSFELRAERCYSLPNSLGSPLGCSLDSLDSDKMQDIQKSFLRGQQRRMSDVDLVQW